MAKGSPKPFNREKARREILEALGSYQKRGAVLTDTKAIADRLKNESDRGLVIILAAYVEDALTECVLERINENMSKAQRKRLTAPGGPLNSFAAVTNVAEAMGLLSQWEADVLGVLKAMRNACSHSRLEIDFSTKELQQAAMLLIGNFEQLHESNFLTAPSEVFRATFILVATEMLNAGTITDDPFKQGLELFGHLRDLGKMPPSLQKQTELSDPDRRQAAKAKKPRPQPRPSEE